MAGYHRTYSGRVNHMIYNTYNDKDTKSEALSYSLSRFRYSVFLRQASSVS